MGKPMDCQALREAVETWPELDRLRQLREALTWWKVGQHEQWCRADLIVWDDKQDLTCTCGFDEAFEARALARRLVGIEEEKL